MYDELVKRLREEASGWCANCCYRCGDNACGAPDDRKNDCDIASELQAADAIEELSNIVHEYQKFDGFLAAHGMFEQGPMIPIEPLKEEKT